MTSQHSPVPTPNTPAPESVYNNSKSAKEANLGLSKTDLIHAPHAARVIQERLTKLRLAEVAAEARVQELQALAEQYEQSTPIRMTREVARHQETLDQLLAEVQSTEIRLKMIEQRQQILTQQQKAEGARVASELSLQRKDLENKVQEKFAELEKLNLASDEQTNEVERLQAQINLLRKAANIAKDETGKLSESSFLEVAYELIKIADLTDSACGFSLSNLDEETIANQFAHLRKAILSLLGKLGVAEVVVEPGTRVDIALRRKIVISEHINGPGKTQIQELLASGYAMLDELGQEIFLRKPEVVTADTRISRSMIASQ